MALEIDLICVNVHSVVNVVVIKLVFTKTNLPYANLHLLKVKVFRILLVLVQKKMHEIKTAKTISVLSGEESKRINSP